MTSRIKFLISLGNLIKNGAVKTVKQAMDFAEQQFGKIDKSFTDDIINVFKKEGKTKKGDVVPINKQGGIVRRPEEFATRKEYERYLDETLGPPDDVFGSPLKDDLLKEWDKLNAKNVTPKDEGIPNVLTKKQKDKLDNFFDKNLKKQKKEKVEDLSTKLLKQRTEDIEYGEPMGALKDESKDIKKVIDEKEGDDFIDFVRKSGDEEGANKIQKEVDRLNTKIDEANKRVEIDEGIKSTQEYKDIVEELRNSEIGNTYAGEDLEKAALDMLKARNKLKGTLEAEQALKKRTDDIASGDPEGVTSELMLGVDKKMKEIMKAAEELKKTTSDPKNIMDEILKSQKVMAEGYKKGNIRTAVRWFMRQEADAGKLKLSKDDYDALQVYAQTSEGDPINIFRRYYGEDALQQIDEIGDVFKKGESFNHYAQLLRENVHPSVLTPKTKGLGQYDPDVLTPQQEDELRKQLYKEQEQKQMLEDFDTTDRTKNAHGGLIDILKL
tara:strand:- start:21 stop:1508 length:1488 start_codon:yes stop_codon:yes gene_type:complete